MVSVLHDICCLSPITGIGSMTLKLLHFWFVELSSSWLFVSTNRIDLRTGITRYQLSKTAAHCHFSEPSVTSGYNSAKSGVISPHPFFQITDTAYVIYYTVRSLVRWVLKVSTTNKGFLVMNRWHFRYYKVNGVLYEFIFDVSWACIMPALYICY